MFRTIDQLAQDALQIHLKLTAERILTALHVDELIGFCTACGEEAHGIEPGTSNHVCETCGEWSVYGAKELSYQVAASGR